MLRLLISVVNVKNRKVSWVSFALKHQTAKGMATECSKRLVRVKKKITKLVQ